MHQWGVGHDIILSCRATDLNRHNLTGKDRDRALREVSDQCQYSRSGGTFILKSTKESRDTTEAKKSMNLRLH